MKQCNDLTLFQMGSVGVPGVQHFGQNFILVNGCNISEPLQIASKYSLGIDKALANPRRVL